jgi:hypothetical protein
VKTVRDLGKLEDGEKIKHLHLPLVQARKVCHEIAMTLSEHSIVKAALLSAFRVFFTCCSC